MQTDSGRVLLIGFEDKNDALAAALKEEGYTLFFEEMKLGETLPSVDIAIISGEFTRQSALEIKKIKASSRLKKAAILLYGRECEDGVRELLYKECEIADFFPKPLDRTESMARIKNHARYSRLNNSLDFLLKLATHEFIIPLSVIETGLQLQRMDGGDSGYLDSIASASTTLHGVYKNMAYILSQSVNTVTPKSVDLCEFVTKRCNYLRHIATSYSTSFKTHFDVEVCDILFDESLLERVIDNLLSNAAKHTVEGSAIDVFVYERDKKKIFEVKNRCQRVDNLAKIFEEFYRGSNSRGGLGLGLYITLEICERFDADIKAEHSGNEISFRIEFGG